LKLDFILFITFITRISGSMLFRVAWQILSFEAVLLILPHLPHALLCSGMVKGHPIRLRDKMIYPSESLKAPDGCADEEKG
jgi:hypothetical protein